MGLDMYLHGRKSFFTFQPGGPQHDGFPIDELQLALGYWRKHPNLHGYIVAHYGTVLEEGQEPPENAIGAVYEDGDKRRYDDCSEIELDGEALKVIIEAIQKDELPATDGFFFGESYTPGDAEYEQQKKEDLEILGKALGWLTFADATDKNQYNRTVTYRASW